MVKITDKIKNHIKLHKVDKLYYLKLLKKKSLKTMIINKIKINHIYLNVRESTNKS